MLALCHYPETSAATYKLPLPIPAYAGLYIELSVTDDVAVFDKF